MPKHSRTDSSSAITKVQAGLVIVIIVLAAAVAALYAVQPTAPTTITSITTTTTTTTTATAPTTVSTVVTAVPTTVTTTIGGTATTIVSTITTATTTTVVTPATTTTTTPTERPTIRIISFNKGFMWTDLFDENDQPLPPLQKFMEEENINVVVEFADEATVRQKVQLDFTSHTGVYDITLADSFALVPTYGGSGYLEPLDDYIVNYPTKYLDFNDILPKAIKGVTMEGHIYALPHFSFAASFNYNKYFFDKYNVPIPTTIDEFQEALQKLKDGLTADGIYGKIYPISMRGEPRETTALDVNAFVWGMGGCWFEKLPDGRCPATASEIIQSRLKPTFNTTFYPGFKLYTDILRNYATPETPSYDFSKQINDFATERALILFPQSVNAFVSLAFVSNETTKPRLKFAPTVSGREGRLIQQFWSMSFGINRDSKHKLEAWKVLNLLTGKATQEYFSLNVFPFPSLISVLRSPEVAKKWGDITGIPNIMEILEESLATSEPHYVPYLKETNLIHVKIGQEASAVIAGLKTAEQAVQDLQSFAVTVLGSAGYFSVEETPQALSPGFQIIRSPTSISSQGVSEFVSMILPTRTEFGLQSVEDAGIYK